MAFWNKTKENKHTFSDIIRGMQHSVNTAEEILETHYLEIINKYFKEDGTALTKRIRIDDNNIFEVPLISLVNQNSIAIDEMEIEFKAKINSIAMKSLEEGDKGINRSSFEMDFTPSEREGNTVLVKIKFKVATQPEGVSRIVDEFDKKIQPLINTK